MENGADPNLKDNKLYRSALQLCQSRLLKEKIIKIHQQHQEKEDVKPKNFRHFWKKVIVISRGPVVRFLLSFAVQVLLCLLFELIQHHIKR